MKETALILIATGCLLSGCNNNSSNNTSVMSVTDSASILQYSFPDVITRDSANKMLSSYLNSINYQNNDTDIRSITFSAPLLRKYLDSVTGSSNIAFIKLMLAHKLSYINAGHGNQMAGYSNKALTLIIAGYDTSGNYIYYPTNLVIDKGAACPTNCPPGTAGNSLFPTSL